MGVGEVCLDIVSGALFFDGVAQIFDILGMGSGLFRVLAPENSLISV